MIQPRYLKKGDTIGIVSTARKISLAELKPAIKTLESWGLQVVYGDNLFLEDNQFAGNDQQRAADLQWMLNNPNIQAVICARGGYGTSRIIDSLDFSILKQEPKWIIGFSDVTVLLSQLFNEGICSIHGTMPIFFNKEEQEKSTHSLKQLLFGETNSITYKSNTNNISGKAKGRLIGGNLSILNHLLGSSSDIDFKGKILFLEDLDEYLYHIDRMVVQLKRANKLQELAGIIVGQMSDMNDNAIPFGKNAYEIIQEHCSPLGIPICYNFPVGHTGVNMALPVGVDVQLLIESEEVNLSW